MDGDKTETGGREDMRFYLNNKGWSLIGQAVG
jgi:hypothetical protein